MDSYSSSCSTLVGSDTTETESTETDPIKMDLSKKDSSEEDSSEEDSSEEDPSEVDSSEIEWSMEDSSKKDSSDLDPLRLRSALMSLSRINTNEMIDFISMPYKKDNIVTLKVKDSVLWPPKTTMSLRITNVMLPFTASCVMEVEIVATTTSTVHPEYPKRFVLKLFDWRFVNKWRKGNELGRWGLHKQSAYENFVARDDARGFIHAVAWRNGPDISTWSPSQYEAFIYYCCRGSHESEIEAYDKLRPLQGKNIPLLFADVYHDPFSVPHHLSRVRGILIERIPGYRLDEIADYAPRSSWQEMCDRAIDAVNKIGDHGVLIENLVPNSVLVRYPRQPRDSEVVVVDFARCRFRGSDISPEKWTHEKCQQNEEGDIGFGMAETLGSAISYKPSYRYFCSCWKCLAVIPEEGGIRWKRKVDMIPDCFNHQSPQVQGIIAARTLYRHLLTD